ncbi:ribosome maturation factor RimP [Nanchangia anserum]|uniref:ribosome maturation factor RimP n=1 Tax=Nanchangia anserum TaxID=2692125 RepID=UPI001883CA91|nr:ribosome maturation factor RimP [Nanchangia anserum]QOX81282.1 ribosome maturation factor RimP [Nanchangia anserum]
MRTRHRDRPHQARRPLHDSRSSYLPDGPGGIDDIQLAEATRAISATVDEIDPIAGTYTLEVTTPGIERPLETPRHFRRAQGHLAEIALADGTTLRGRIADVADATVSVDTDEGAREVAFADIASARMAIEW